ncbi:MAG: cytochrome c [Thermomicrobiales bacterium]
MRKNNPARIQRSRRADADRGFRRSAGTTARHPKDAREKRNPIISVDNELLAEAREHFADHCAICHANAGSGNTLIGRNLYPKAPDLRKSDMQSLTDGEIFYIIHNGIRFTGMPAWGGEDDPVCGIGPDMNRDTCG